MEIVGMAKFTGFMAGNIIVVILTFLALSSLLSLGGYISAGMSAAMAFGMLITVMPLMFTISAVLDHKQVNRKKPEYIYGCAAE